MPGDSAGPPDIRDVRPGLVHPDGRVEFLEVPAGPPLAKTLSKEKLYEVVLDAMAGTDCGDCEYPDCEGYSKGIVYEGQKDLDRCAPGGEDTKAKLYKIMLGTKPPAA